MPTMPMSEKELLDQLFHLFTSFFFNWNLDELKTFPHWVTFQPEWKPNVVCMSIRALQEVILLLLINWESVIFDFTSSVHLFIHPSMHALTINLFYVQRRTLFEAVWSKCIQRLHATCAVVLLRSMRRLKWDVVNLRMALLKWKSRT